MPKGFQDGFLKIFVIIPVILLILGVIAFFAVSQTPKYYTENLTNRKPCSRTFTPQFNDGPYYQGSLFDDHFHLPAPPNVPMPKMMGVSMPVFEKDVTMEQILCHFDEEHTVGAVAFYTSAGFPFLPSFFYQNKKLTNAPLIKQQVGGRINLFLSPQGLSAADIDNILAANPGVFDGIGEIALYATGGKPDDKSMMDIFRVADKYHIPVMYHPDMNELQNVINAAKAFPSVKMMVHGYQLSSDMNGLDKLMAEHPNIYYSIDSATLYAYRGGLVTDTEEQFVSQFKNDFDKNINEELRIWEPVIEKYPDRFMWGTDRFVKWHYSEQISQLYEEFARAFIGRLPKDVQEKYAYKNAEAIFAK